MRPVIGISTYRETASWGTWSVPAALVPQTYADGVALAGGVPVLLPPAGDSVDTAADAVAAIAALVLSGGADVDPARYGEAVLPTTVTRPDRDAWELALLHAALATGLPVLAICRGMQLLNVAVGGTLYQHLPDVVGTDAHQPTDGVFGSTMARVAADSRIGRILGDRVTVHCHHHQAVRTLGDGLAAVAFAADGTIEAVEHTGPAFVLGVQWHPERDAADQRLFQALIRAAAERAAAGGPDA